MKLVLIEWEDPGFAAGHWENREPFTETAVPCVSCGILLHEDNEKIQLVLNLNKEFYSQGTVFPKSIIKRMWRLKVNG